MRKRLPIASQQLLLFTMGELRFALNLAVVERIVQAVEIMPLPKAPPLVLGVINVQGQVMPVVDLGPCFGLPPREVSVNDQFILARTANRRVAVVAEAVTGIRDLTEQELVSASDLLPGVGYIHGVVNLDDELVFICDLEQVLPFSSESAPSAQPSEADGLTAGRLLETVRARLATRGVTQ